MINIQMEEMENQTVTLVGQDKVGKTALFLRFRENQFVEDKTHKFEESYNKSWYIGHKKVAMTLYDTGNIAAHNPGVINTYLRKSRVMVFVYDMTDRDSFDYLSHWGNESERKNTIIVLVGNKLDLKDSREVTRSRALQFAQNFDIPEELVFEVSAKTGEGVDKVFEEIARVMYVLEVEPKRMPVSPSQRKKCCWCC